MAPVLFSAFPFILPESWYLDVSEPFRACPCIDLLLWHASNYMILPVLNFSYGYLAPAHFNAERWLMEKNEYSSIQLNFFFLYIYNEDDKVIWHKIWRINVVLFYHFLYYIFFHLVLLSNILSKYFITWCLPLVKWDHSTLICQDNSWMPFIAPEHRRVLASLIVIASNQLDQRVEQLKMRL